MTKIDVVSAALLGVAFRHVISEPNIEAGFEQFCALAGEAVDYDAFRDRVSACLREGLIHEPIRLPEGALQCHWRLELTPKGVDVARALVSSSCQTAGHDDGAG